jgi:hypothetical protein
MHTDGVTISNQLSLFPANVLPHLPYVPSECIHPHAKSGMRGKCAPSARDREFFQDEEEYKPPTDYKLVFEAFCLRHFLSVFEFIAIIIG